MNNKYSYIYGFEEYRILDAWSYMFSQGNSHLYLPYCFLNNGNKIINKDFPVVCHNVKDLYYPRNMVEFTPSLYTDNRELLNTAKKVYVHPSCKLSRSMLAEKYKKSLDPWAADVIVLPRPDYSELSLDEYALFINDNAEMIVRINIDKNFDEYGITFKEGDKLGDYLKGKTLDRTSPYYTEEDFLNSEFFYQGEILNVPNSYSYIMDILTCSIPRNKTVFEESIQESLSNETNKLDFDSLTSIKDMLESSDSDTVSAGLKSLSMMDWMHYPNSIKFILSNTSGYDWRYNKAADSTSVKYMLKTISKSSGRNRWPGKYDYNIFEEDFELLKRLKMHYDNLDESQMLSWLRYQDFMKLSTEGILTPVLRKRTV